MSEINDTFQLSTPSGLSDIVVNITYSKFSKNIILSYNFKTIFEKHLSLLTNKGGETFVFRGTSFRIKWRWNAFGEPRSIVIVDMEDNIIWQYNSDEANTIEVDVFTPWWAWIFILACASLFVISGGGGIPSLIGTTGALTCRSVSRNPEKSVGMRLLQCIGITGGTWVSTFAIITIVFFMIQPEDTTLPWIDLIDFSRRPIHEVRQIALSPNIGFTLADTLEIVGDEITYEFEVAEDFALYWQVVDSSNDTRYRIISADGSEIKVSRMSINSSERLEINQTGTFQIHIVNVGDEEVHFEAQIWYLPPPSFDNYQILEISPNERYELRGTIDFPGQIQFYQILLDSVGNLRYQDMDSEIRSLQYSVSDTEFDIDAFNELSRGTIRLQSTSYYLAITSEAGDIGNYAIDIGYAP